MTLTDALITYDIEDGSNENVKYSKCHLHLAYEIRNVKETKLSNCTKAYLFNYSLKSIGQYEKIDFLFSIDRKPKLNNRCEKLIRL